MGVEGFCAYASRYIWRLGANKISAFRGDSELEGASTAVPPFPVSNGEGTVQMFEGSCCPSLVSVQLFSYCCPFGSSWSTASWGYSIIIMYMEREREREIKGVKFGSEGIRNSRESLSVVLSPLSVSFGKRVEEAFALTQTRGDHSALDTPLPLLSRRCDGPLSPLFRDFLSCEELGTLFLSLFSSLSPSVLHPL